MRSFWVADLTTSGEMLLKERYEYVLLERLPGAPELIGDLAGHLYRSPEGFELDLADRTVRFRWVACSPTCGIISFRLRDRNRAGDASPRADEPLTAGEPDRPGGPLAAFGVLLSGLDFEDDTVVCRAVQNRLVEELRDTGLEAGFDLIGLKERPLLASFNAAVQVKPQQRVALAMADRCFAAAYFRRLALA